MINLIYLTYLLFLSLIAERSGTGWDEIYYSTMEELNIAGKKVSLFVEALELGITRSVE